MNEKDDKTFNRIARIAAPIGLPLFGISYLLGDTTIGRIFLITGLTIWLGGGFVILLFLRLSTQVELSTLAEFSGVRLTMRLAGQPHHQTKLTIKIYPMAASSWVFVEVSLG